MAMREVGIAQRICFSSNLFRAIAMKSEAFSRCMCKCVHTRVSGCVYVYVSRKEGRKNDFFVNLHVEN